MCFSCLVYTNLFQQVNHILTHSWNQPVLSNEGEVSCSRKQREPWNGIYLMTERHPFYESNKLHSSVQKSLHICDIFCWTKAAFFTFSSKTCRIVLTSNLNIQSRAKNQITFRNLHCFFQKKNRKKCINIHSKTKFTYFKHLQQPCTPTTLQFSAIVVYIQLRADANEACF